MIYSNRNNSYTNDEMLSLDSLQTKNEAVIDVSKLDNTINFNFEKD